MSSIPTTKPEEVVVSYKGFNADLQCRGFQFAVGATYETERVQICTSGFHACANPLDVLNYYSLLNENAKPNRFCVVEQSGQLARYSEDSKIASAKITITAELDLGEFIKRAVQWVIDACKYAPAETASSGYYAQLAASGDYAKLAASGYSAKLAASGYSAKLAASGPSAKLAASGDSAQLAASGYSAKLAASGDYAKLAANGNNSVIASSSNGAIASGALGTWISLAEFDDKDKCVGFATGCIGTNDLKADTPYRAKGGKLVEAK